MSEPYTGPKWVGPLFKWIAIGAVLVFLQQFVVDTEVEFECNER